jgi:hydrogenase maturation protease
MNRELVDRIAAALLYEGYLLYPYRPSVKNRQRWSFGGLYPEAWCRAHDSGEASSNQTECLIEGTPTTALEGAVRFLHLTARLVEERTERGARLVEALRVGDRLLQTWQEAEERQVVLGAVTLGELETPRSLPFTFPGGRKAEEVRGEEGEVIGALVREQQALAGIIEAAAARVDEGLFRVTLRVVNCTPLEDAGNHSRDDALLCSLVSANTVLGVREGAFVSLLEPPAQWREAAAACRNVGTWPVLVGEEGQRDTLLSAPIILYDYPQVAPESPGDFFDATEIDEMLTLRILTLTDEEKRAMAGVDERARALLARTEALAREQLLGLHGTVRGLRPVGEESERG